MVLQRRAQRQCYARAARRARAHTALAARSSAGVISLQQRVHGSSDLACPRAWHALRGVMTAENLNDTDASRLRELAVRLPADVLHAETLVDRQAHARDAVLKGLKFGAESERFAGEQHRLRPNLSS